MAAKHTREELIYLSKLAEQCERYDGKLKSRIYFFLIFNITHDNFEQRWLITQSNLPEWAQVNSVSMKGTFFLSPSRILSEQEELHGAFYPQSRKKKTTKEITKTLRK